MATVAEITAKYENFLLPVLAPRDGICATCKSWALPGRTRCYKCNEHLSALPYVADAVVPVALAAEREQWAHELSGYKNSPSLAARNSMAVGIGAVLWRWLDHHEACVEEAAGAGDFSTVTTVPSTRGRQQHPLSRLLKEVVKSTADRYVDILRTNPSYSPGSRDARPDRFYTGMRLEGEPILLIDDQWTSGGHAQSAASALKLAGAGRVAVVALGRRFDRRLNREDYREAAETYYRSAHSQGWSWTACCLCGPVS